MSVDLSQKNNIPKAYRNGFWDFYGRDFYVTPDVLIPRPETEQMIDVVLSLAGVPYLPGVKPSSRVLPPDPVIWDVGTGSGCVAITIKKEFPEAEVYASDISERALRIAQKNAIRHNTPMTFIVAHLLKKVNSSYRGGCLDAVDFGKSISTSPSCAYDTTNISAPDVVVANLPYVDENWDWLDKTALAHEPAIALYARDHGLALIKELVTESVDLRIPYLVLEADPCQHDEIVEYAMKKGLRLVEARGYILTFCSLPE